jgi:hypothetical protein
MKKSQDSMTYLAVERNVANSSQNQAFNALLFLFRHVLDKRIDDISEAVRAKRNRRLPVVLTKSEIERLFAQMSGLYLLMARSLYEKDRKNNVLGVQLPYAFERKSPNAGKEWAWFWIRNRCTTGVEGAPKSSEGSTMRNVVTPSFAWSNSRQANRKARRWREGIERLEEANAFGKTER